MAQFDYLKTKDQLGRPDSTGLLVKKVTDSLNIEDRPLIIYKDTLDEIERWNLTTWNGGIWYGTVATSANMVRVVNRNNTHYERFINNNLKDVPNTTGTWDITNKRIVLTDGQQAQNLGYFKNEVNITN